MPAADERFPSVGERRGERFDRLAELGGRVGGGDEQRGLVDGGERGGVRVEPPFALQLREDRRPV